MGNTSPIPDISKDKSFPIVDIENKNLPDNESPDLGQMGNSEVHQNESNFESPPVVPSVHQSAVNSLVLMQSSVMYALCVHDQLD